jgi:RND family efflux transporter MFP subunit
MDYTKAKLNRVRALYERQTLSKEELDEATSAAIEAVHAHEEAQASYKLAIEGPRKEKIAQMEAKVAAQEEAVRRIEDRIEKFTVRAYFDGYVTAEHTEVGHWVKEGEPIAEIEALTEVEIRVLVLENYIDHVRKGSQVRVEVGALADRAFVGEVSQIIPQADVRSRTFPVHVRLANTTDASGPVLKSGMFARVMLPVGKTEDALLISKDALVLGQATPMVYVVDPDPKNRKQGTVRPVPVELGVADGGLIQIRGPVKPGDQAVVRGNERLRPSQSVTVIETLTAEK